MYWFEKTDDSENIGYIYHYFDYIPFGNILRVNQKFVLTHEEFNEWYQLNKRL